MTKNCLLNELHCISISTVPNLKMGAYTWEGISFFGGLQNSSLFAGAWGGSEGVGWAGPPVDEHRPLLEAPSQDQS